MALFQPVYLPACCSRPPRLRQFGYQRLGSVVLPLQRLPQFRRRALGGLLELRRLVALLARQRHLRLEVPPRLRQFSCQRLGPVVLPLQRLPQFRRRALGGLLELRRLVARDDFGVETDADKRRRDEGCGDPGNCKSPPRVRRAPHFRRRGLSLDCRCRTRCNDLVGGWRLWRIPPQGEWKEAVAARLRRRRPGLGFERQCLIASMTFFSTPHSQKIPISRQKLPFADSAFVTRLTLWRRDGSSSS